MHVDDLIVEVRDGSLTRVGQIDSRFLSGLLVNPMRNAVGAWQLALPATHDLVGVLRTPKAGLIVTGPSGVVLSGPMTSAVAVQSAQNPDGEWTFAGCSDLVVVRDALAWPQPSNPDPSVQNVANDVRTGIRETLLHQYVDANIGPSAPAARKAGTFWEDLALGVDGGRGGTGTFSPRFQNLLELLRQVTAGTDLWFDVRQEDDQLVFVTGVGVDRTGEVRMDIDNQQLDQLETGLGAPQVTDTIVAGQGEGTARTIITRSNPASRVEWGRRVESFIDQRQTDDLTELRQAGDDALADGGSTIRSLKVTPSDDVSGTYGVSWTVGDRVTAVLGDSEVQARVTGAVIAVVDTGVHLAARIGDDVATDWESGVDASIGALGSRVSSLERNTSGTNADWVALTPDAGYIAGESLGFLVLGGVVFLRGSVTRTAGAFPTNAYQLVFTLPEDAWPDSYSRFPIATGFQASASGAFANVYADGRVDIGGTGASSNIVRLSGIVFPAKKR